MNTQEREQVVYLKPYVDFRAPTKKERPKPRPWWKFWASRPVGKD